MYAKKLETQDLMVKQTNDFFTEFKHMFELIYFSENEVTYMSTENFSKHTQPNHIREALMKGYVEMSHINLAICRECLHAEYEAEHMVERLVSGG
ncbi:MULTISPECIES: transcriptional regulator [unclassified Lysinibacillus]|uniref:transcriptional regulator n=1 Tax=unclassified Lysinibacillus TaxID=2636778 RepID=UPI0036E0C80D